MKLLGQQTIQNIIDVGPYRSRTIDFGPSNVSFDANLNKAYRSNAHLLYIAMQYNGNFIEFYIIIITT